METAYHPLTPGARLNTALVEEIAHVKVGYFKVKADCWPAVCAAISKPWPVEAVGADLAWWQDQRRMKRAPRIPSHRTLAERWGWTEWQARRAMQQLGDPPAQEGTNRDEHPARAAVSSRQQEDHMDLSGMSRFDDEDREREEAERSAPRENVQVDPAVDLAAEVERRVAERLREEEAEARIAEERRRLAMLGSVEVQMALATLADRAGEPLTPSDVRRVRERVRHGATAEELLAVDQWVRESPHSEAEYLRGRSYGPATTFNDGFARRLKLARAWGAGAEQAAQPPRQPRRQPRAATRGLMALAAVRDSMQDEQSHQISQAAPSAPRPFPLPPPLRLAVMSDDDEAFFGGLRD